MNAADPLNIDQFAADNGMSHDDKMLGIVLSGALLHMGADPVIREMLANNSYEEFVEKFEDSPELANKFAEALLAVRELATA